jgi:hypothetical protein
VSYQNVPDEPKPHEPYGFMERELTFKLLASHAMVDAEFFEELRRDPEAAAAQLHIRLTDRDLDYLNHEVDWAVISRHADEIRDALKLELVTNSW